MLTGIKNPSFLTALALFIVFFIIDFDLNLMYSIIFSVTSLIITSTMYYGIYISGFSEMTKNIFLILGGLLWASLTAFILNDTYSTLGLFGGLVIFLTISLLLKTSQRKNYQ